MSPLIKLAANAARGQQRYVCLAGAGLSVDAGLPTGWGIMMSLAGILRASEGEEPDGRDLETWFVDSEYAQKTYSELVESVFPTSLGQHDALRDQLHAAEPGEAHKLLAGLAASGVLRCIITANFDNLIEQALSEAGLRPQVVATDEQIASSGPLIQCREFRVYKPHGSIEGGRLLNTPADLEKLFGPMERELASIISDHGLIVLGYAGEDPGIRRVFATKRQYLYPTFWVNPAPPPPDIPSILGAGTFDHVACSGASSFLGDLSAMYHKLDALDPGTSLGSLAREADKAIRSGRRDVAAIIGRFWVGLESELKVHDPVRLEVVPLKQPDRQGLTDAIGRTVPACLAFADVADAVAEMGTRVGTRALFDGFQRLAPRYWSPVGYGGLGESYFDYWRFTGHELLVSLVAALMKSGRWRLIADLFDREFYVENPPGSKAGMRGYEYLSSHVGLISDQEHRGTPLTTTRSSLLGKRHNQGPLADRIPLRDFTEADYLMALRSAFNGSYGEDAWGVRSRWIPWSYLVLHWTPRYLLQAERTKDALRLGTLLGSKDVADLRERFKIARLSIGRAAGQFPSSRMVDLFSEARLGSRCSIGRTVGDRVSIGSESYRSCGPPGIGSLSMPSARARSATVHHVPTWEAATARMACSLPLRPITNHEESIASVRATTSIDQPARWRRRTMWSPRPTLAEPGRGASR